jgi:pimeloyl-ACP methyl ester carboxylesterase
VRVYEWGKGARTAVILHGWGSRASRFVPMARSLVEQGWRVLAIDAPGHGLSPGNNSSLPRFVTALAAVIARHGPAQALIGHSLGALAICLSVPQQERIVLISMPSGARFLLGGFLDAFQINDDTRQRLLALFKSRFHATVDDYSSLTIANQITTSVLVIHDQDDDIVPVAHSETLVAAMKAAKLHVTHGLGHSALTRDVETIKAVHAFLQGAP